MTAFIDGALRGALWGSVALLIGLLVADIAAHLGLPAPVTVIAGFWAMLVVVAVKRP